MLNRQNKVVCKLLSQPHKHLPHVKLKTTQLREAINGWLHPWTHPAFRCQTQCREGQPANWQHAMLTLQVSMCRTSQFARCFMPAQVQMWNALPYTVFDTGTFDGFKGTVNRLVASVSIVFFSFLWRRCLCGCESNLWQFCFFPLGPVLLVLIIIIIIIKLLDTKRQTNRFTRDKYMYSNHSA